MQLITQQQKLQSSNQAGFSFREQRKATGQTTSGVAELIPTNEFNLLPPKGMQVNPAVQPAPQIDVIPKLDSFRPIIAAKDFSESNFQLI